MKDLKLIKEKYGEKMMHFCRSAFPTILETPGLLYSLLKDHFEFNKFLYEDIEKCEAHDSFKNYIYSLLNEEDAKAASEKTPKELFEGLGYDFYECKTEEEIQRFKRYYKEEEELCTFSGGRLKTCYVFFAVKKYAESIKRLDEPKRQDEYGTSVISIQFTKGDINTLSIKNRYNHTVNNPDATFSNNLENITPGLTDSFEKTYNLNISQTDYRNFELEGYVKANDGKYYKYNYEINNIYYCPNNIIIDNYNVIRNYEEKEKYLVLDYFILDLVNKKIKLYDDLNDSLLDDLQNIKKIEILKSNSNKILKIETNENNIINIEVDKTNKIISYFNNSIQIIGNRFMYYNKSLINLELPNVKEVGNDFCYSNKSIENINMEQVEKIGNCFFPYDFGLKKIKLPNVKEVGNKFLFNNRNLYALSMPKLQKTGDCFLYVNKDLEYVYFSDLIEVSGKFLYSAEKLREAYFPNLKIIKSGFMYWNNALISLSLPSLINVEGSFLARNNSLIYLSCPNLKSVTHEFLSANKSLREFYAPNLESADSDILYLNYFLNHKVLKQIAHKEKQKVKVKTL